MNRRRFVSSTIRRLATVLALGIVVAATAFGLQAQAGEKAQTPAAKHIRA